MFAPTAAVRISVQQSLYSANTVWYTFLEGSDTVQYLDSFILPTKNTEENFLMFSHSAKTESSVYSGSCYPFGLFPEKQLDRLSFSPITILCGSNGSGKSTLLNIIAQKLGLERTASFNCTPLYEDYLRLCEAEYVISNRPPKGSMIITSDDVFDYMLDIRAVNEGVDNKRERLFSEYEAYRSEADRGVDTRLHSLEEYDLLRRRNLAKSGTKSRYAKHDLKAREIRTRSNGESAYLYFTDRIRQDALYLLDEPENSLSASLQLELARFIEDSVRFYNCQFIISSHSPFMLAMKGARIYDMDRTPVCPVRWTEIEAVRTYRDFFEDHRGEF